MQIHRIRGNDLRDALERARRSHGEDAVVLSHEPMPGGGVTVSVTRATDTAADDEPGARDVARRMAEAGASPALVEEIVEAVRASGTQGAFAIDAAATALAERFRVAQPPPPPAEGPRVLVFAGPTGAGKTTTVAKLARHMTLAGRNVHVATLDSARGGHERLRATCRAADIPFYPVRFREDVPTILEAAADADALLVDTVGRSPHDRTHLEQLEGVLGSCFGGTDPTTYLVVSAATGPENLLEVRRGFAGVEPRALVVTKLDETRRTAVPFELARESDLPTAFLCNGQKQTGNLYRATPERIADLILGGRVR